MRLTVNELAMKVKDHGIKSAEGQKAFGELFIELEADIKWLVRKYVLAEEHRNLNLDEDEIFSMASFEGIVNAVKDYDITKGDFMARYRSFIPYTLNNVLKKHMGGGHKSLSTSISIELPSSTNTEITISQTLRDDYDYYTASESDGILKEFEQVAGKQKSEVIETLIFTSMPTERTHKYCQIFEVDKYTAQIRKRVSRIKAEFKRFCENHESFQHLF